MGCDIVWKRGNNRTKGCWFLNRRSRHLLHTCIEVWRKFHAEPAFLLVFFLWQKRIVFQSSLDPSFHLLITEFLWFVKRWFRIKGKILGLSPLSREGLLEVVLPGWQMTYLGDGFAWSDVGGNYTLRESNRRRCM